MPRAGRQQEACHYLGTMSNPEKEGEECEALLLAMENLRFTFQRELGDENHVNHYQFFLSLPVKKPFRYVLNNIVQPVFGKAHLERAAKPVDAGAYCRKPDTRVAVPWSNIDEAYLISIGRGRRNDLVELHRDIASGHSVRTIVQNHFANHVRYSSGIHRAMNYIRQPYQADDVRGVWVQGPRDWKIPSFRRELSFVRQKPNPLV